MRRQHRPKILLSLEIICLLHCRKMSSFCVCGRGGSGRNTLDISTLPPNSTSFSYFQRNEGLCAIWAPWGREFGRQRPEHSAVCILNTTVPNLTHFSARKSELQLGRRIQKYRNTLEIVFICHCPAVEKWRLVRSDCRGASEAQGKRARVSGIGKVLTTIVQKESVSLLPVIRFKILHSPSVFCLSTGLQVCGCTRKERPPGAVQVSGKGQLPQDPWE